MRLGIPSLIELLYQSLASMLPWLWKANPTLFIQLCGWQISFVQMRKDGNSSGGPDSANSLD